MFACAYTRTRMEIKHTLATWYDDDVDRGPKKALVLLGLTTIFPLMPHHSEMLSRMLLSFQRVPYLLSMINRAPLCVSIALDDDYFLQ